MFYYCSSIFSFRILRFRSRASRCMNCVGENGLMLIEFLFFVMRLVIIFFVMGD